MQLLQIMALTIPFGACHSCICGYYYGCKKPTVPAAAQLFEQLSRVSAVFLIYRVSSEQGRSLSPLTAVVGLVIGEFASMLFCVFFVSGEYASPGKWADGPAAPSPLSLARQMCSLALPGHRQPALHESAGQCRIHPAAPLPPAIWPVRGTGLKRLWDSVRYGAVLYPLSQRLDRGAVSHAAALRVRVPGRRRERQALPHSPKDRILLPTPRHLLYSPFSSVWRFLGSFFFRSSLPGISSSPWPGSVRSCI